MLNTFWVTNFDSAEDKKSCEKNVLKNYCCTLKRI